MSGKDVTVVGLLDHAEIWDTEKWNEYNARSTRKASLRTWKESIFNREAVNMEFHHVSILLQPCLDALNIKPDAFM